MSIIAAKSWLPPELTTVQPYSMSPVLGCDVSEERARCAGVWVAPATGTCVGMDRPELMISSVFVAPMDVQRQAQKGFLFGIKGTCVELDSAGKRILLAKEAKSAA